MPQASRPVGGPEKRALAQAMGPAQHEPRQLLLAQALRRRAQAPFTETKAKAVEVAVANVGRTGRVALKALDSIP